MESKKFLIDDATKLGELSFAKMLVIYNYAERVYQDTDIAGWDAFLLDYFNEHNVWEQWFRIHYGNNNIDYLQEAVANTNLFSDKFHMFILFRVYLTVLKYGQLWRFYKNSQKSGDYAYVWYNSLNDTLEYTFSLGHKSGVSIKSIEIRKNMQQLHNIKADYPYIEDLTRTIRDGGDQRTSL